MDPVPPPINQLYHELYRAHCDAFFAFALVITRRKADAEDAIHTAFAKALRSEIRPQHPKAYMMRAIRNSAFDITKRRARSAPEPFFLASVDPDYPADTLNFLLDQLDPLDGEIIVLKLLQGYTFQETAALLGEKAATVATRYRRAMDQLRGIHRKELSS